MAASRHSRQMFVRGALAAAAATALLVLLLAPTKASRWLENGAYDARARWSADHNPDPRIVVIDIDNASFENLKEKLGRWPWTRQVWSTVLHHVAKGKPKVVVFDAIFTGVESPDVDSAFARELQSAGNVVLAYTFNNAASSETSALRAIAREGVPADPSTLGQRLKPAEFAVNAPLDSLADASAGLGCANFAIDTDGITRSVRLSYIYGDRSYPSLAVRTAELASGKPQLAAGFRRQGRYAVREGWRVPVDADARLLVRWHGNMSDAGQSYTRIPIWQLVCSIYPSQCNGAVLYPPEFFRDRIVMIGASATGSYEVRPTPFDDTAPGFITHVTAIDNLLHGQGIVVAPGWFLPLAVIAMALGGALILMRISSAALGVAVFAALLALYAGAAFAVFKAWSLWLPMVAPMAALVVSFGSATAIRYATTGRELRRTRGTLDRYMAPQLVEYVLENLDNIEFGGKKRELTILFSDVRNFTSLTESSDPLELIAQLNQYLTAMTDVIFKYDGVVDKFIGDGILAYWGAFDAIAAHGAAPKPADHVMLAAQAALEMFERLAELNRRWTAEGRPPLDIGVGINTGEVIFGNVGAGKKVEFTVIGDPVNLASRLEGLNKELQTHIIISEFTRARLGAAAQVRSLGGVTVKGKTTETTIYELVGLQSASTASA